MDVLYYKGLEAKTLMGKQIPWNKYEAALLLDTYLKVDRKELKWKEAVASLSKFLRARRKNQGFSVDEKFRNVNGINLQLALIQNVMTNGHRGLKSSKPAKIFYDIAALYHSNEKAFWDLLQEAKQINSTKVYKMGLNEGKSQSLSEDILPDGGKVLTVLRKYFSEGYRLNETNFIRFTKLYQNLLYSKCELSREQLEKILHKFGFIYNNTFYIPDLVMTSKSKHELIEYISNSFKSGIQAIYYQALFEIFDKRFLDRNDLIFSAEMLKEYLAYELKNKYLFFDSYLSIKENISIDLKECIEQFLIEKAIPVKQSQIMANFENISSDKIFKILKTDSQIIFNGQDEYFYSGSITLNDSQKTYIVKIIDKEISDNGFLTLMGLIKILKLKMPDLMSDTFSCFSYIGIYNWIKNNLNSIFTFTDKVISKCGQPLYIVDLYAEYSKNHSYFTLQDLKELSEELGNPINMNEICKYAIRLNKNEFCALSSVNFNIDEIDMVINKICPKDYMTLLAFDQLGLYSMFPKGNYSWNIFLLEGYVDHFSHKFTLLHRYYAVSKATGIIVKNSSGLKSMDDVLVNALVDCDIPLNTSAVLDYFVENGFLSRHRSNAIEPIIYQARIYRKMKG